LIGLFIALIGITAAHYFNMPVLDGVASILIGVVLAISAFLLARETKGLLMGETAIQSFAKIFYSLRNRILLFFQQMVC
jgi:divalent metal cation (Fe/Co/Zn/Cd) transporter